MTTPDLDGTSGGPRSELVILYNAKMLQKELASQFQTASKTIFCLNDQGFEFQARIADDNLMFSCQGNKAMVAYSTFPCSEKEPQRARGIGLKLEPICKAFENLKLKCRPKDMLVFRFIMDSKTGRMQSYELYVQMADQPLIDILKERESMHFAHLLSMPGDRSIRSRARTRRSVRKRSSDTTEEQEQKHAQSTNGRTRKGRRRHAKKPSISLSEQELQLKLALHMDLDELDSDIMDMVGGVSSSGSGTGTGFLVKGTNQCKDSDKFSIVPRTDPQYDYCVLGCPNAEVIQDVWETAVDDSLWTMSCTAQEMSFSATGELGEIEFTWHMNDHVRTPKVVPVVPKQPIEPPKTIPSATTTRGKRQSTSRKRTRTKQASQVVPSLLATVLDPEGSTAIATEKDPMQDKDAPVPFRIIKNTAPSTPDKYSDVFLVKPFLLSYQGYRMANCIDVYMVRNGPIIFVSQIFGPDMSRRPKTASSSAFLNSNEPCLVQKIHISKQRKSA